MSILVAAVVLLLGWQGPSPNKAAPDGVQQSTKANQSKTPPARPVAGRPPTDQDESHGGEQAQENGQQSVKIISAPKIETESKKDPWDKALVIATWILVFVGGFQIIFLWRTVNATRDNAKAALLNAQALTNSERAWLRVTMEKRGTDFFALVITNHGRTPAEIVGVQRVEDFPERTEDLPHAPNYGMPTEFIHRHTLVQNEQWIYETTNPTQVVPGDAMEEIRKSRRRYYQYGVVKYRDVLSDVEHETRFSFMYSPLLQEWFMNGPTREYTKQT